MQQQVLPALAEAGGGTVRVHVGDLLVQSVADAECVGLALGCGPVVAGEKLFVMVSPEEENARKARAEAEAARREQRRLERLLVEAVARDHDRQGDVRNIGPVVWVAAPRESRSRRVAGSCSSAGSGEDGEPPPARAGADHLRDVDDRLAAVSSS